MAPVREITFELLRGLGVTTVFGNPGSTEIPLLKDFPQDFDYVLGLQEATALGMAEGYARGTGKAALVNLHTAPGLGNAMGAMVTAYHNRSPLMVISGQQDRRHIALEPLLTGKLVELAEPYVKRSHQPLRAGDVPGEIRRAYHTAMNHPQGPVFLSVPMDDWDAEADPLPAKEVFHRSSPDPEGLERITGALRHSRTPALVVGAGVERTGAFYEVVELAEKTGAAVWAAPVSAMSGFPQDHPLFQGYLPPAQKHLAARLSPHDVVVVLGAPVFLYYPYVPGPVVEEGTRLFQITEDPGEAAGAAAGTSVIGDISLAVEGVMNLLPEKTGTEAPERERPQEPEAGTPMSVDYVMHAVSNTLPDDVMVVDESSSSKVPLHRHVRPSRPGGYYSSATGGLGFAMPAAVGLKLAVPERPVVCVIGDGATMYSPQALWSAAQYGAAVPFIVINNRGYSILKSYRDSLGAGEVPGQDLPDLDVLGVADGLGCKGERAETPDELRAALERALSAGEPYVLDVLVDTSIPPLIG